MKSLWQDLQSKNTWLAVIGLGYVGLPLAVEFGKRFNTIGFDVNDQKIRDLKNSIDTNHEVTAEALKNTHVLYTSDPADLKKARFLIVAVPTPIDESKKPNLMPVIKASELVGQNLSENSIVVYESTVYPGVTEEECVPILEKISGLRCGLDFKVGYSPERINPGDKEHTLTKILKIVSGQDQDSLDIISEVYGSIIQAGIYKASSIKVAEAAKVIENTQRDLNIALMNELSIIFNKMNINTQDVLEAAGTKWNFINMKPGLVGGHCIGVDPYYLTYKAEKMGYHPQVILAGRRINDGMGKYVAEQTVKMMIKAGLAVKGSRALILGFTFKENVSDIRNTRVIDVIHELEQFGVESIVVDPIADRKEIEEEYGIHVSDIDAVENVEVIILASPHDVFLEIPIDDLIGKYRRNLTKRILVDIKGVLRKKKGIDETFFYVTL